LLIDGSGNNGFAVAAGTGLQTLTIQNSQFNNNVGDGLQIVDVAAVVFVSVSATGNDPGVFMSGIGSFSDTDGNFSGNDDGGIYLEDVAGDVTLVRTILQDNDANNDGVGDGFNASPNANIHVHMTPAHRLGDRGPERFSVIVQYADGSPASCDVTMGWIPQSPGEGVTNRADSANDVTFLAEKSSRFGVVGVGGVVLPGPGALPFTARDAERREG
jgi:hypothetical protein